MNNKLVRKDFLASPMTSNVEQRSYVTLSRATTETLSLILFPQTLLYLEQTSMYVL